MHTQKPTRIALIHALQHSIVPIRKVFEKDWPEAELVNLLDDSLSVDLKRTGAITDEITRRILSLARYAETTGAAAILFTCSAFGKAIDVARSTLAIPVLKPNEAMFEEALKTGGTIGMLTTFGPSVPSMEAEFNELAASGNTSNQLTTVLVEEAMSRLNEGDVHGHNSVLQEAASQHLEGFETIMLAQFSTAQAYDSITKVLDATVLTSPTSAVRKLKRLIHAR